MSNIFTSSKSQEWQTPQYLFNALNKEFNFTLDAAATKENALCKRFCTKEDSGLEKSWTNERVFLNPPYKYCKEWLLKCAVEDSAFSESIVILVPSRTGTQYWHKYVYPHAKEILFIKGRLNFSNHKDSATFDSALILYGKGTLTECLIEGVVLCL